MGSRDLRQVFDALDALVHAGGPEEAARAVMSAAVCCVGADSAVVTRLDGMGAAAWAWPSDFIGDREMAIFEVVNAAHPWPLAMNTRQGPGFALRISDVWTERQYRSTPMYTELFHRLTVRHQVAFSVPTTAGHSICVALQRDHRDFSTPDCDNLNALRPCLATAAARRLPYSAAEATTLWYGNLTCRQFDVLRLAATGLSDLQIGRRLGVSKHTVSKHLQHVYRELGVTNRAQAADRARSLGLLLPATYDIFESPQSAEARSACTQSAPYTSPYRTGPAGS